MANWSGVITNGGNAILNGWVTGKTLSFDSAAAGTGYVQDIPLMAQTALVNQKQVASLLGGEENPDGIRLRLRITAAQKEYTLNQFGVWAHITGGQPIMLAIFQNIHGIKVPSIEENPEFVYTFHALIMCSNTGEWSVNIDTSALATQGDLTTAIEVVAAAKQDKIMVDGILKGDGEGGITAATPGKDYAWPVATGQGAPTKATQGEITQHYIDADTGKEYICKGKGDDGFIWELAGATDAADLTYGEENLADVLADMAGRLSDVEDGVAGSTTLTGHGDPTEATEGKESQMYVNIDTGAMFICAGVEAGKYIWKSTGGGGTVLPQIVVNVATGSAVTCSNGATTLEATSSGGKAVFDVTDYGEWTVQATLDGQASTVEKVMVDAVKQYSVSLSYFSATLTVTAEANAQVTATDGTHTYTGTCGSNGKCALSIKYAGNYTVKATKEGVTSNTVSTNVATSGTAYTATVAFITLTVTIDSGSAVTVKNGSTTLTGNSTGTVKFYLPNTGTWSVTATKSGETATGSIACSSYKGFSLEISYVKVFGVQWDSSNSSTALARLKKANDPLGVVNVDINSEPVPAIGTGAGSSPFDAFAPWNGMEEYNIINGAVSHKKGQSGFSRTSYDTMVYIPEFYYKIVADGTKIRYYVADKAKSGFAKHPGSGRYVGRYNTISGNVSKSGAAPLVNITRATARSGARGKGNKWYQYDYATWCAIWLLYLVEFADWDSQKKVGRGYCDGNNSAISSGGTDSMAYHTGRAAGTDGKTAVQYRHIENLWGNVFDWVDGINFSAGTVYICTNPANYADDTATNYTNIGTKSQTDGYIKSIAAAPSAAPWAFYPTATGGSETTYIPDYARYSSGWRVLKLGGGWSSGGHAGLFYFYASNTSSHSNSYVGARLLYVP